MDEKESPETIPENITGTQIALPSSSPSSQSSAPSSTPCGPQRLPRRSHDPLPDFIAKLTQLHETPNRPGVLAQHEYAWREPPVVHAGYTKCKSRTTWTRGTPVTFDDRVDWLEQTDKIHSYEYQPQKSVFAGSAPSSPSASPSVVSSARFSSLVDRYNNRGASDAESA